MNDPLPLQTACTMLDVTVADLWLDYMGLGGNLLPADIVEFLDGRRTIDDFDYDRLAQALNELFLDVGQHHPLAYTDE